MTGSSSSGRVKRREPVFPAQIGPGMLLMVRRSRRLRRPLVPSGIRQSGQSGSRADLYEHAGIDADEIVDAAVLALELNEG